MITEVSARNFKGQTFKHELGPVTVFAGPNASGKSARLDALRLALWGHLPEIGKQPGAILGLSSDPEMEVSATLNGKSVTRRWVARTSSNKALPAVGGVMELPEELLSASSFFALSPPKRMEYIFDRATTDDSFDINGLIVRLKVLTCEGWSKRHQNQLELAITTLPPNKSGTEFNAWLRKEIDNYQDRIKVSKQVVDRQAKAIAADAEITQSAKPIDIAKSELESARQALDDAMEKHREAQRGLEKIKKQNSELATLKSELVACEVSDGAEDGLKDQIKESQQEVDEYQSQTDRLSEELDEINTELNKTVDLQDANESARHRAEKLEVLRETCKAQENSVNQHREWAANAEKEVERSRADLGKHAETGRPGEDSVCESCGTNLRDIYDQQLSILKDMVKGASRHHSSEQARLLAAKTAYEETLNELNDLEKMGTEIVELPDNTDLLRDKNVVSEALEKSREADQANEGKKLHIQQMKTELANLEKDHVQRKMIQKQIDEMEIDDPVYWELQLKDVNEKLPALREALNAADLEHTKSAGQQQNQLNTHKRREQLAQAEAELDVHKLVQAAMKDYRNESVNAAIGPFITRAREVADGFLRTHLEFKDGEVGRTEKGRWIAQKTFSGTEQAITYVAFCHALNQSSFKLILMDEMGRMDDDNKRRFVNAMVHLASKGIINQFVCVDVTDDAYMHESTKTPLPGITLIHT